jgi:hypothetical protein
LNKNLSIKCPFCQSHNIIKKGLKTGKQRYQCKSCKKKFCNSQKHIQFKQIYEFLQNKSLRNFEYIEKDKLHKQIISVASKFPTCSKLNNLLHIKFSGRIGIDAIFISVEGVSMAVLIAFDLDSFDVVNFGIFNQENEESWITFLRSLVDAMNGLYPKVFVSDGKKGINNALRREFEFVPRQVCVAHKIRRLENIFPKRDLSPFEKVIKEKAKQVLLAKTKDEFDILHYELALTSKSFNLMSSDLHQRVLEIRKASKALGVIRYQKSDFLTQFKHPNLVKTDRTNNSLEGVVNSFLKTRIKLFRGFKSKKLIHTWMNLLIMYYRFHKFKASKFKWRNRHSPIETNWNLDLNRYEKIVNKKTYSWIENLSKS